MATEKPKVSNTLVNFYALSNGMNTIAFGVPTLYLTMFMTDYLGISPVAIGTGMLIARTIDFIVSIIAGVVIEKAHLKHGKYLSWIRIATVTCFFGNIVQMLDTTAFIGSPTVRLLIVMIFYIMFHSTMNFFATSRAGIIVKLAGADMTARVRLTARQSQIGAAVSIISSAITLPLVQLIDRITGSPSAGYFVAALIFSSLFVICNSIFAKLAAPFDPPEDRGAERARPTIGQMVSSVVTNKQMLLLFAAFTITGIGNQLVAGITTYFFRVTGNFSKYTYVLTARSITALVFSMFTPAIGKKLGKKNALVAAWCLNIIINVAAWLFAYNSKTGEANILVMAVIICLRQGTLYLYMVFTANYWLDCGEYGYYTTGVDNRTMATTVMNWPTKISMALGGSLSAFALSWIGYNPPDGTPGNMGSFDHMERYMMCIGLIPAICIAISVVLIVLFYKLTDEQAAMYAKANVEREEAAKAAKAAQ